MASTSDKVECNTAELLLGGYLASGLFITGHATAGVDESCINAEHLRK